MIPFIYSELRRELARSALKERSALPTVEAARRKRLFGRDRHLRRADLLRARLSLPARRDAAHLAQADGRDSRRQHPLAARRSRPSSPGIASWSTACVGVECVGIRGFYRNTFIIVIPAVIIATLIGALNGFALTKFRFPAPPPGLRAHPVRHLHALSGDPHPDGDDARQARPVREPVRPDPRPHHLRPAVHHRLRPQLLHRRAAGTGESRARSTAPASSASSGASCCRSRRRS